MNKKEEETAKEMTVSQLMLMESQRLMPKKGTIEWLHQWAEEDVKLPAPIDLSITGSTLFTTPPLKWYNFHIYPSKIKIANTGYTVILSAKWKGERPFVEGGPLKTKYIFSQLHFHWGSDMTEGSAHSMDGIQHPMEIHLVLFNMKYLTPNDAFKHIDGIVIICYLVRYGAIPDSRLDHITKVFPNIRFANTSFRVEKAFPLSEVIPMFEDDYFMYWGSIKVKTPEPSEYTESELSLPVEEESSSVENDEIDVLQENASNQTEEASLKIERKKSIPEFTFKPAMWIISRSAMMATCQQIKQFNNLWDPWDEPNTGNVKERHERLDRHVFLINRKYDLWTSLAPVPRTTNNISMNSECYEKYPEFLPPQNFKPVEEEGELEEAVESDHDF